MRNLSRVLPMLCVLFAAMPLLGCHRDEQAAQDSTRRFVDAIRAGNHAALLETLTAKGRQSMADVDFAEKEIGDYSLGEATIDGDEATVPVIGKKAGADKRFAVKLHREEGQWRVHSMALPADGSYAALSVDFENPETSIAEFMRRAGQQAGEIFQQLGKGLGEAMKGFSEGFQKATQQVKPAAPPGK